MNKEKINFLPLKIIVTLSIILYIINLIFFSQYGMSSDSVIATMCADIIYKEGIVSFFKNYISQQAIMPLYIIYYIPFLLIRYVSSNLILVTKFGILFHQIALMLSAYFLLKQLNIRKEYASVLCFFLSSMSSMWFYTFMMFDPFYMVPMYLSFSLYTLALKILQNQTKYIFKTTIIFLTVLYICIIDLRLGSIFCAPFLMACVLKIIIEYRNTTLSEAKFEIIKYLKLCIPIGVASALALLIREKICDLFFINQGRNSSFAFDSLENMQTNLLGLLVSMHDMVGSTESGTQVLSMNGILWFVSALVFVFIILVFPILLFKNFSRLKDEIRLYLIFYAMNFLLNTGIIVVSTWVSITLKQNSSGVARFMLPTLCLAIILFAVYLNEERIFRKYKIIKNICIMGFMTIFFMQSFSNMFQTTLNGMSTYQTKQEIINYLYKNNCYSGYATYWNASINTVISKDNIKARPITIDANGKIQPFYDLSSKTWFRENGNENAFLILSDSEYQNLNQNKTFSESIISENIIANYYVIICKIDWINANMVHNKGSDNLMNKLSSNIALESNCEYEIDFGQFVDYFIYYPAIGNYNLEINVNSKDGNQEWNATFVVVKNKNGVEQTEEYKLNQGENFFKIDFNNTYDVVRLYIYNDKMLYNSIILSDFTYSIDN